MKDVEIILDDAEARRAAKHLQLLVIGSAGILIRAKERHLVDSVRGLLDELVASGFYLDKAIFQTVLKLAGE